MRLRDIIEELDRLDIQGSGAMASQVTWFCKKLWEADAYYTKLERDKASAEAMTTVWKESYLDQVRENIKLQAEQIKKSDKFEKCDNCTAEWYIEQFARVLKENAELRSKL